MIKCMALLIPAYQPNQRLVELVNQLEAINKNNGAFTAIVIINDGSGTKYDSIFKTVAQLPQVTVIHHAINLGKGAALKTGFNHILIQWPDVMHIVTADADGQHAPDDIMTIAHAAAHDPGTLILGARTFQRTIPLRSLLGNQITRLVMGFFTGLKLADTQTGLRAWPRQLAMQSLRIPINGYDFEMETLVRAKEWLGSDLRLKEVSITTIYEEGNRLSHFNPLFDSMRIYFVFIRYCGSGFLTALVDNIVFIIAFSISGSVLRSQVISRAAGAAVSFLFSRHIVFRSSANYFYAITKFIMLVIAFGFLSYGMIHFLNSSLGMRVISAKILAELILFLASFAIQRDFIFKR